MRSFSAGLAPINTGRPWSPAKTDAAAPPSKDCGHSDSLAGENRRDAFRCRTPGGNQTGLTQSRERVAQLRQPTAQATARRVTDAHVRDQFRRAESAVLQIGNRLGMTV